VAITPTHINDIILPEKTVLSRTIHIWWTRHLICSFSGGIKEQERTDMRR